jgi:hypothetical protein
MSVPVYLPLFLGILLATAAPRLARALPPRAEVWFLTVGSVVAAVSWVGALGMIAFTGLARTKFVARHGHYRANDWRTIDPVGVRSATTAGVALGACMAVFFWAVYHEVAAQREITRLSRGFAGDETLVFVDDITPHAYALGGRRPRIVLSRGLLRTLGGAERRAVLSHEAAHLRHRHHLHLRVLRLAAAVHPCLRPCVPAGVLAVERWADEETAANLGDRTLVARTLLRAALAGVDNVRIPAGVLAHTTTRNDVGRRVTALMQAPPRLRWSVATATSVMVVATVASPVYTANHLDTLFDSAVSTSVVMN